MLDTIWKISITVILQNYVKMGNTETEKDQEYNHQSRVIPIFYFLFFIFFGGGRGFEGYVR